MNVKKIIVDSSVISEHLTTARERSYLRELSGRYFCYTTVFSAIELFGAAKSLKETQAVQDAMDALKVLGINAKSAKNIGAVLSSSKRQGMAVLTAAVCMESRLPIVTMEPRRYAGMKKLVVISAKILLQ